MNDVNQPCDQPVNLDEWHESDRALRAERNEVREALGALPNEGVVDAARRCVRVKTYCDGERVRGLRLLTTLREIFGLPPPTGDNAQDGSDVIEAVRRVVSECDDLIFENDEARSCLKSVSGTLAKVRETLRVPDGADVIETAQVLINDRDAARRDLVAVRAYLGAEVDEARQSYGDLVKKSESWLHGLCKMLDDLRGAAERVVAQRDAPLTQAEGFLEEVRLVLAASESESTKEAANRVVAERDAARSAIQKICEVAERINNVQPMR